MNLVELALKSTIVLSAAALAATLLRGRPAALRHLVWAAAVIGVLAMPLATVSLPPLGVAALEPVMTTIDVYAGEATPAGSPGPAAALRTFWLAGAALMLVRLGIGLASLARITRRCRPYGRSGRVRIRMGAAVKVPTTWGALRPVVLLPAEAEQWPKQRLDVVLAHELCHVRRVDWLTQFLAHTACALYWFHPLAWYAAAELRRERELACDDSLLRAGVRGSDYAQHLVDIASGLALERETFTVGVAMAQRSQLETRVLAMLNPGVRRDELTRKLVTAVSILALCILLPLSALQSTAQGTSGRISGVVLDPSGAAVADARIMLRNEEGRNVEILRSGEDGAFELATLPAGRYTMEVAAKGFQLYKQTGIAIAAGAAVRHTVPLQIGKVGETLDIVGKGSPARPTASGTPGRIKVGGGVQALKMVHMVRPLYPDAMKAAGIEGTVLLQAVIARDGTIAKLEVKNTQVHEELAKAAQEAVSQWRYEPTLLNGEPVEVITEVTVNFRLMP